ncbi:hypothetical protein [Bacillus timonensis]|uniref:hypothetical protein n=1 Tax=Bacillus timonensis TaxID=1033734 RepID=UPI0002881752|nr:hypothetical protein [Bacillus timonensis]
MGPGYELATRDMETQKKYFQQLAHLPKINENHIKYIEENSHGRSTIMVGLEEENSKTKQEVSIPK